MLKAKISFINKPGDLVVREVEVPDPAPDQVLIKVKVAGICGSDLECYEGKSAEGRFDLGPYTMGHEWSGQVIKIGKCVKI
jgi:threonine dehydrogenase-like Zn-dependent dehydrogenase